jgi:uncharacterized membrane protein YuzA (DUF378 family)
MDLLYPLAVETDGAIGAGLYLGQEELISAVLGQQLSLSCLMYDIAGIAVPITYVNSVADD